METDEPFYPGYICLLGSRTIVSGSDSGLHSPEQLSFASFIPDLPVFPSDLSSLIIYPELTNPEATLSFISSIILNKSPPH